MYKQSFQKTLLSLAVSSLITGTAFATEYTTITATSGNSKTVSEDSITVTGNGTNNKGVIDVNSDLGRGQYKATTLYVTSTSGNIEIDAQNKESGLAIYAQRPEAQLNVTSAKDITIKNAAYAAKATLSGNITINATNDITATNTTNLLWTQVNDSTGSSGIAITAGNNINAGDAGIIAETGTVNVKATRGGVTVGNIENKTANFDITAQKKLTTGTIKATNVTRLTSNGTGEDGGVATQDITSSDAGDVQITSKSNVTVTGDIASSNNAKVNITADNGLAVTGALRPNDTSQINLTNNADSGDPTDTAKTTSIGRINAEGGTINVNSTNAATTVTGTTVVGSSDASATAAALNIKDSQKPITFNGDVTVNKSGTATLTGNKKVDLKQTTTVNDGTLNVGAETINANTINYNNATTNARPANGDGGQVTLNATKDLNISGNVSSTNTGSAGSMNLTAGETINFTGTNSTVTKSGSIIDQNTTNAINITAPTVNAENTSLEATGVNSKIKVSANTAATVKAIQVTGALSEISINKDSETGRVKVKDSINATGLGSKVNIGNASSPSVQLDGAITAQSSNERFKSYITVLGQDIQANDAITADKNSDISLGDNSTNNLKVTNTTTANGSAATVILQGDNINKDLPAEKSAGALNATDGGTITVNNTNENDNAVTKLGTLSADKTGTIDVNKDAQKGSIDTGAITAGNGETDGTGGKITVGNDATTKTTAESVTANDAKAVATVKGKVAEVTGAAEASNGGVVNITGANETGGKGEVKGTATATGTGSKVNVSGETAKANAATANTGGVVSVGDTSTKNASLTGAATATGENSNVTVKGTESATAGSASAADKGKVTVGGDTTTTASITGTAQATNGGDINVKASNTEGTASVTDNISASGKNGDDTSTVTVSGKTATAEKDATADNGGVVNITGSNDAGGKGEVKGTASADGTGSQVNVAGETATAKAATAQNSGVVSVGDTSTKNASVTGTAQATNGGDINVKASNTEGTASVSENISASGKNGDDASTVTVSGKTATAEKGATADNGGVVNITGSNDAGGKGEVKGTASATGAGSQVNVSGETATANAATAQNSGVVSVGDTSTKNASVTGTAQATNGGDINVKASNTEGTASVTDNISASGKNGNDASTVTVSGKTATAEKGATANNGGVVNITGANTTDGKGEVKGTASADGTGSQVNVAGETATANAAAAQNGGVVNITGANSDNGKGEVKGDVTADGAGSQVNVKGKTVTAGTENSDPANKVEATNGGAITLGDTNTTTAAINSVIKAAGKDANDKGASVTVVGQDIDAKKDVTASDGGKVTLGNEQTESLDITGSATASTGGTIDLNAKNPAGTITVSQDLKADGKGATVTADAETVNVTGDIASDNEGKVTVNGKTVSADDVTSDHSGNTSVTGDTVTVNGKISSDNGGTTTVTQNTGNLDLSNNTTQPSITANNGGTTNVTATNGDLTVGKVASDGTTTLADGTVKPSEVVLTGNNITAKDELTANNGGKIKLDSKGTVTTEKPIKATNGGEIEINAPTSATINSIEQDAGSTVKINSPQTTLVNLNANGATLVSDKPGSVLSITNPGSGKNTYGLNLAINPAESSYLNFTNSPAAGQTLQLQDKAKYAKVVADLKEASKAADGIYRIPFAGVANPNGAEVFKTNSQPVGNGFDVLDLYLGHENVANATANDRLFLTQAGINAGEFYYASIRSVGINSNAQNNLNNIALAGLMLATDMINSARSGVPTGEEGLWATYSNADYDHNGVKLNAHQTEIGYDRVTTINDRTNRFGVSLEYDRASGDITNGDIEANKVVAKVYNTTRFGNGAYTNVVAAMGRVKTTAAVDDETTTTKLHNDYAAVSAEYGMRFDLGNGWYAIPQAQLQYTLVQADKLKMYDADVKVGNTNSVQARTGVLVGQNIAYGDKLVNFYGSMDIYREFAGKQQMEVDSFAKYNWEVDNRGTWYRAGLGASMKLTSGTALYLDVSRTFGSAGRRTSDANVGVKITF
ncbi:hypothetical protein ACFFHK_00400 [Gallibacterium trehalosifermentans]|uniref:Autotransporter domain-containing protein n=1 Tax=Gallibacterium trehalosifermentans TaxID=516935 RepID=A0ABV6GYG9_9PAST